MKYDPQKHRRRSIRLDGYDYAQAGAYFVTICTQDRVCWFGEVGAQFIAPHPLIAPHPPGAINRAPTTLGEIVRAFKAVTTRTIRQMVFPEFAWQRNYYEHIIRDGDSLKPHPPIHRG